MARPIPIGMCVRPDKVPELAPGYDHLELPVAALMPLSDDLAYGPVGANLGTLSPAVLAFNAFVPGEIKLVGDKVDWEQIDLYVQPCDVRLTWAGK